MNANGRSRTNSFKASPTFAYALVAKSKKLRNCETSGIRTIKCGDLFAKPPPSKGA